MKFEYNKFQRNSDNVIISGNGPSLKHINYFNMPNDYDIFRCNQFYLEDKYYLGKRVDLFFFTMLAKDFQYKTYKELTRNNDYDIKGLVVGDTSSRCEFMGTNSLYEWIKNDPSYNFILSNGSKEIWPTMGSYMLICAKVLGYKNIYICGMDFYDSGFLDYGVDCIGKKNLSSFMPLFSGETDIVGFRCHNRNYDKAILKYIKDNINVIMLSGSKETENVLNNFLVNEKDENCIKDIIL